MTEVLIIIPTYNAEKYIPKIFQSLELQTIKKFKTLVIDSSSKDNTVALASKHTDHVVTIPQAEFDHGGTRAKAAQMIDSDIIIFLTQDALLYDQYSIENIIKTFDNNDVGAAYGKQISYEWTNPFGKHLREFNYANESYTRSKADINKYGIKTAFLSNSFAAYRTKYLKEVNWFKTNLILGEDTHTAAKMLMAGYHVSYASNAKVYHSHNYTIKQEFKRYFDIGAFHCNESWMLKEFGKAEGEGFRYIKSEFLYLVKNNHSYLLPLFFIRNLSKYIGYKLGYRYQSLPKPLVQMLSMHKNWFRKNEQLG